MKKQHVLIEDLIREELMVEYYMRQAFDGNAQRLDEGKLDLAKNFKKIWGVVKSVNGGGKMLKKMLTLMKKVDLQLLPSLITKGIKWVPSTKKTSKIVSFYKSNEFDIKATEKMATFTIGSGRTVYALNKGDKSAFEALCDFMVGVYELIKGFIGLIPGCGTVIVLILELIESVLAHWWEKFKSELERVWAIAKTFFEKQIPFTFEDLEKAWGVIKDKAYSTIVYGGAKGAALKNALSLLKGVRANLDNTKSSQLDIKIKYIACLYRDKRTCTQQEFNTTKKFCKDIMNLDIPTYKQAMKMWPGINLSKDDGTYARHILEAFPWKVLSNDGKSVAGWFSKSCKVASKSFAELEKDIDNIGKPKVKNNPSYSNAHPRGGMYR